MLVKMLHQLACQAAQMHQPMLLFKFSFNSYYLTPRK